MKYFVLLAGYGETKPWDELSAEEQAADMAKHGAFAEACEAKPEAALLGGEALGRRIDGHHPAHPRWGVGHYRRSFRYRETAAKPTAKVWLRPRRGSGLPRSCWEMSLFDNVVEGDIILSGTSAVGRTPWPTSWSSPRS